MVNKLFWPIQILPSSGMVRYSNKKIKIQYVSQFRCYGKEFNCHLQANISTEFLFWFSI